MKYKINGTSSLLTKYQKYIDDPISIANAFNKFFTSEISAEIFHSKIKFSNELFENFLISERKKIAKKI